MDMQIITSKSEININKHFKVSAGPGAGKTKFLINHIKNVLHNSNKLGRIRKIACITYTNVGVKTIIQRLGDEIDHIEVSTIHSLLFTHIVKPYLYLINQKYEVDLEKLDAPFEHIVSRGYFIKTNLSKKYVKEDEMKKIYWEVNGSTCKLSLRNRNKDYHNSLFKYKQFFWEKGIIHYEDVLAFAWEILNSSDKALRIIRSKFPYFFIDEFQDTNPIQTEIIKLIAEKETTVGVIGDKAQSIYEFQGADVKQFNNFHLPGMFSYNMEDNHRSTENIIKVLNKVRNDITQRNPEGKVGRDPVIIIGDPLEALLKIKMELDEEVASLSYSNPMANSLRKNKKYNKDERWGAIESVFVDSSNPRRKAFISIIKSIEYARLAHYKDSIRELSRHLKNTDDFNGQQTALKVIKELTNDYNEYKDSALWELYKKIVNMECFNFPEIRESKKGKTSSEIEKFYKEHIYSDISMCVNILEDDTLHRTIHKAKGSEFDNVLVVVNGRNGKYNEKRDLGFLLNSEIEDIEEQRVYYVACSRAKKNLYINIPKITEGAKSELNDLFTIMDV
ncbi:DNA helicase-2/ATP-dependent DNA helicase PcrA [Virgibacillus natechei]|uniref:DNA 3'-5' helicase n=1 Tax=Virgibacillus natechei TaxID=1216297 RepID=A0ABS4IIH3_9BACI|nr:ATP-dependent helicase [Virgibacillus natechei]MBP1970762.1 DNA helicase-2/ATP-dependent DNA helicase PcrA [Virgibacillus natechei]UZD12330.1 ATP-dependent helicase [Virgibacillus natechei]